MERWADVIDYEGIYEISDGGRVRRVSERRKQTKLGDHVKSPSQMKSGYLQYVLCAKGHPFGQFRAFLAHRLVWRAFQGEIPEGLEINHLNGNKKDNRLENLEVCSRSENISHAIRVLRVRRADQRGEKNAGSKLTADDVIAIHVLLNRGVYSTDIARIFSISDAAVSLIKSGDRWTA